MMRDVELEEGVACCDYNLDQRIEDVLGPFKRAFKGLVTRESLGLLGGQYGSFLPMYKHPPPITSQSTPLQIVPNLSTPGAPNNHGLEGALSNPVQPLAIGQHTSPVNVSAINNASKNEATTSNVANPSEQNSLSLRIKVCSDKPLRKNHEVYSGLGLLLSPSSATGNDSEEIGGSTIKSPGCVLRDMTSIFVPGNRLVSPLNENLLCLTKAYRTVETKVALPVNQFANASSSRHEEVKQIEVKLVDSRVKCEVSDGRQNEGPLLEKCVSTVSFDSKRDLTNESHGKLSKVSTTVKVDKEAKKNIVPVKRRETKGECVSKGSTAPSVCKTELDVFKHTSVHSENKVGPKVSQGIDEFPSERKNKLTGVQSTGISSSELVKLKSRSRLSLGSNKIIKVAHPQTQQTQVAPVEAASHENWVACDLCNVWRLLPIGITEDDLPENWWCSMSTWLPGKNYCDVSEDDTTQAVREMNFRTSSQNTYHANLNANSQTLPNGWKKNKSRSEGSNSSQVETSHSSMNSRQKRKNVVNDATVNGEPRPKKLKTEIGLDQHDHLTSTKIKNEPERQPEITRASSKSKLLVRKSCEEVEILAKKRKLKDQQDTPPNTNTVKEKRLKTSNTDVSSSSSKVLISRKAHTKSSIRPEVPRKLLFRGDTMQSRDIDASQSQKLGGTVEIKRKEASKFTGTTSTKSCGKGSSLRSKDKDAKYTIQRVKLNARTCVVH